MARVTVEDCLEKIPNRFALTVLAFRRARELLESRGTPLVHCDNKAGVTALREVETGGVRFRENVEESVAEYVAEQRKALERGVESSGAMDLIPFSVGEGEEGDDFGIVEELKSDLTEVDTANTASNTDEADNEGTPGETESTQATNAAAGEEAASESSDSNEGEQTAASIAGEGVDEEAVGAFLDADESDDDDDGNGDDDGSDADKSTAPDAPDAPDAPAT